MAKSTAYYQLIPAKLLPILPEIESEFSHIPGYSLSRLQEVISILAYRTQNKNEQWTPVKMEYVRRCVPQAEHYIKKLIDLFIIERSVYFEKGVSSYEYRFCDPYVSKFNGIPLSDPKLSRRIEEFQGALKRRNSKKYPGQNQWLGKMTINSHSLEYINSIEDSRMYNYAYSSIMKIMNGFIYITVDKTAGRLHSNLTNLPKYLRKFLTIDGSSLANIDIKNCQPYLSTLILTNPKKISKYAQSRPFSMMLENLHVNNTEDVKRYVSLVVQGIFYEYLWKEFGRHNLHFKSRDDVKKQLYVILFAANNIKIPARKIFRELFPEVDRIFTIVRGNAKGNKFQGYQRFAILLQKIESHIVLDRILKRIHHEHPSTIAVTIHDSIMTGVMTNQIELVKKIMMEELTAFVGYAPRLVVESKK